MIIVKWILLASFAYGLQLLAAYANSYFQWNIAWTVLLAFILGSIWSDIYRGAIL